MKARNKQKRMRKLDEKKIRRKEKNKKDKSGKYELNEIGLFNNFFRLPLSDLPLSRERKSE